MDQDGEQTGRLLTFPDDTDELVRGLREEDIPVVLEEIRAVRSELQTATTALQAIAQAGGIDLGDGAAGTNEEFTITFGTNIPAGTTGFDPVVEEREIQTGGRIDGLVVSYPSGTQQAAGVQLRRSSGEKLFPRNPESDFIGFDDKTQQFDLNVPVTEGEIIEIVYANADPNVDHFINGGFFNVEVA